MISTLLFLYNPAGAFISEFLWGNCVIYNLDSNFCKRFLKDLVNLANIYKHCLRNIYLPRTRPREERLRFKNWINQFITLWCWNKRFLHEFIRKNKKLLNQICIFNLISCLLLYIANNAFSYNVIVFHSIFQFIKIDSHFLKYWWKISKSKITTLIMVVIFVHWY